MVLDVKEGRELTLAAVSQNGRDEREQATGREQVEEGNCWIAGCWGRGDDE